MPRRRRPSDEDAASAAWILLDGLAEGRDLFEVADDLAPLHPKSHTFPGELFLWLGAEA